MAEESREIYQIQGTQSVQDLEMMVNFVLNRIGERFDRIEGLKGNPTFYKSVIDFVGGAFSVGQVLRAISDTQLEIDTLDVSDVDHAVSDISSGIPANIDISQSLISIVDANDTVVHQFPAQFLEYNSEVSMFATIEDFNLLDTGSKINSSTTIDGNLLVNIYDINNVIVHQFPIEYFGYNSDIFGFFANDIGLPSFTGINTTNFIVSTDDLHISCPDNKTIVLDKVVWDDIRINPGSFDRPGSNDPSTVLYYPNGGGLGVLLYEFQVDDYACFTVQIPHGYKVGTDIAVHVHWTPGDRGNEENGKTVGWKIDYSWANIDGTFPSMATADLSDACDGTDHKHQMTPDIVIDGHTVAKGISSMLLCNIRRSDTGTDDTWAGTVSGQLPLILEIDFHYQIDTIGSRQIAAK